MVDRRIRFGFQLTGAHAADPVAAARRAEELGFDIVLVSDHVGRSHDARWTSAWVDEQVAQVRSGAAHRVDPPELNALVQVVEVTDDRAGALAGVRDQVPGLSAADAAETPYLLVGTVDEIVRHVRRCADRWGITYFAVRALDELEPVLREVA